MKNLIRILLVTVILILGTMTGIVYAHGSDPNIATSNVIGMHFLSFVLGILGYLVMFYELPQKWLGLKKK